MIKTLHEKLAEPLESHRVHLFVFFSSLFVFLSFAGTRLFLTDDGVILNQFYNLIHGSIPIQTFKIDTINGVYLLTENHAYGKYSYSLLILSMPFYYLLRSIDFLYGAHMFILQLWALSEGMVVYIIAKYRSTANAILIGILSYFALITINMISFKPIPFQVWGELLSLEFTNILISSFFVLFVYLFFKNFFSNKIAIFASFFVIFATPFTFYAISLKHHSLSLLLTLLAFCSFYRYQEHKDNRFIYFAYVLAALDIWTRFLDGIVLLASLLLADTVIFKRDIKHMLSISIIIMVSLLPFFTSNYLVLHDPFSIIERSQSNDESITIKSGHDVIILNGATISPKLADIMDELGYGTKLDIRDDTISILLDITFLKLRNTFGIFLISPFLIVSFAFVIDRIKRRIKLNTTEKFFIAYIILFVSMYKDYFLSIVQDTPAVLDYRYLLIAYVILLYFTLRIDNLKDLIENRLGTIAVIYIVTLVLGAIYFTKEFPPPFMNIYYYTALITSILLIVLVSVNLLLQDKKYGLINSLINNLLTFTMALSLAQASIFLLFYYWVVNVSYISPSQNYTILPVLQDALHWMYQRLL